MNLVPKLIIAAALAIGAASCSPPAQPSRQPIAIQGKEYPAVVLSNGLMTAQCFLPDAARGIYRGPRFDWSGMVGPVALGKDRFFAPFRVPQDPLGNDDGIGPAEEFGMTSPLGYAEAKAGETFVKIGVGELIKPSDPSQPDYNFYGPYKIARPAKWDISHGMDWIEFHQSLHGPRQWGYDYDKRIALADDQPILIIAHRLTNTGSKTIDTTWYCHNLVNIDGRPIGPEYAVNVPFPPVSEPTLKPADVRTRGDWLIFPRPVHYGISADLKSADGTTMGDTATIRCNQIGVKITGDQPIIKYHLYAESTSVCPEMFIRIHLAPGQSKTWEVRYEFIAGLGGAPQVAHPND